MKFSYSDALNNFQNGKINEAKEICEEILKSEPNNFSRGFPSINFRNNIGNKKC